MDFSFLLEPPVLAALTSLLVLEIILGIDNVIFIIVLANKLPKEQQDLARRLGIFMALVSRVILLLSISWIIGLTDPLVTIPIVQHTFSGRDLVLLLGGFFLVYKAVHEIHDRIEGEEHGHSGAGQATLMGIILQIMILDLVFSLDSVITAVGMVVDGSGNSDLMLWQQMTIMVTAVLVATAVMVLAANPIAHFIERHPTLKMLAFSFLLLIGTTLIAEGFHFHVEKGYIYSAMGFAILVEVLHLMTRRNKKKKMQVTVENQH